MGQQRGALWKALKWMFSKEAPLLFRPQFPVGAGLAPVPLGLGVLGQLQRPRRLSAMCSNSWRWARTATPRSKKSWHATGIEFNRLEKGIAHFYLDQKALRRRRRCRPHSWPGMACNRRVVSTGRAAAQIEPAVPIVWTTSWAVPTPKATRAAMPRVFTQELASAARHWACEFLWNHDVLSRSRSALGRCSP